MNELMPCCPEPAQPSCVVLGTVEVKRGELVAVCNCPRDYVWSFANFFDVLFATLISDELCKDTGESKRKDGEPNKADPCKDASRHVCCHEIEIDCEEIIRLLSINEYAMHYRGTAGMESALSVRNALADAMNFTRMGVYSPRIFAGMSEQAAAEAAKKLHADVRFQRASLQRPVVSPFEILRRVGLASAGEPLVLLQSKDRGEVTGGFVEAPITLAAGGSPEVPPNVIGELNALRDRIAELEARIKDGPSPGGTATPKGRGHK